MNIDFVAKKKLQHLQMQTIFIKVESKLAENEDAVLSDAQHVDKPF